MVKNLPAMWKTWFPSLGWEDLLEEGMATTPVPGKSPWTEEPGGLVHGVAKGWTRLGN